MRIYEEKPLRKFDFWSGGADRAQNLTDEDFDAIESLFEELYPDGMEDTQINDFFWFEFDTIAQHLGYENEEDFDRKRDPNYVEDDNLRTFGLEYFERFVTKIFDDKNWDALVQLADLFSVEYAYPDGDAEYPDEEELENIYNVLYMEKDEDDVYDALFSDDQGNFEFDGDFPTWEELRTIKMNEDAEKD